MNPNDIIAQQQAMLNQIAQNAHREEWIYLVLLLGAAIIHFTIVYLFYARLRDIADELRMFRIAFEMANDPRTQSAAPTSSRNEGDSRYLPKS